MSRRSWTEEETNALRRLAGTMTSTLIAAELSRSVYSVLDKARAQRIKLRTRGAACSWSKYSATQCEQARRMHQAKMRLHDISQRLVIPYNSLHSIIHKRKYLVPSELARVTPRSESLLSSKIISLETAVPGTRGLNLLSTIADERSIGPLEMLLEQEAIDCIMRRLIFERGLDQNAARQLIQSYL